MLAQLPAMSKSSLMIRDIEQSATAMHSFRKFLVQQVDFHDLHLPREMTELALTGQHLQINSLTGNVWPSIWIKPLSYASLALPAGLDLIKRAYMQYFDAQNTTRFDAWKPNDKYKSLQISAGAGTEDTSPRILGIYDPSSEMSDGWPVYEIRASTSSGNDGSSGGSGGCNSSILEYSLRTCSWQIKRRSDRGKNAGWAYCHSPPGVAPEQLEKSWFVWRKADKKWVPQAISVASATLAQTKPRSLRRVIWCHAAGTLTIQVALDNGRHSHVLVTEVQAAVLLSFNSMVRPKSLPVSLTFSQIQATLQLSSGELKGVLTTLVSAEAPVLQRSAPKSAPLSPELKKTKQSHFSEEITTEDTFQLSNAFLGGDLGGLSANNPIILSSIEVDKHNSDDYLFDAGVNSLYGWRNELIDASVVRVLKDAAAQKSGEFANHCRQRFAALSIDSLCYRVRLALNGRSNVSSEDIMRRSERLVSIGVIDKVVGNSDSFRSVAYCYIADVEAPTTVTTDSSNNNNNNSDLLGTGNVVCDKVYGQDLYNHLRIVLGIRSSSSSSLPGGVSKTQFVHRFISWMINANCDVASASVSRRKNHPVNFLDVFAGLIVEFLKTAEVQTNALQLQFCYGIHSACGTINTDRAFKSLRGLNALQMLAHTLTTTIHNGLPNLHNYLALDRVYLEHLPAPIVQDMLNYFRGLLQEPVVKYDQPNVHPAADLSGIGKLGADAFPLPLTSSVADVYTEEDTGRFTPTTEFFGQAGSMNPPPHMRAEADDGLGHSELMKRDIQVMWNRTAVVHKHALIHKFGFPEALLTTLNIAPAIAPVVSESSLSLSPRKESKSSQVRGARQSKDQVRMSFQQLVAATLLTASAEATDSLPSADSAVDSTSFGYLLEEYFFNRLVDHMAELFGTDLQFVDAQQVEEATESGSSVATANAAPSTAAGLQSGPEEDEVRIPCEFCTDSIRVSLFEAHTLACRTGRALEAHPPDPDRPNRPRLLVQPQGVNIQNVRGGCSADPPGVRRLKRPDSSSGVAIALMEALLNSVTATACEVQSAVWESRPEELFTAKALGGDSDEEAHPLQQLRPANAFTFFLESAFDVLDRDGDGYLNPNDFSVVETSFVDLLDTVDPARLYGTARIHLEGAGLKMPSKFPEQPKKGPPSAALSTNNSMDNLAEEDLILLSTPVPLAKTSSLWRSVSHEKSLPSADASRSYSGLEEAEMEMTALVHRAMLIIDDSAAVSTSLLIHYKWDVKTLVEEYIENSRAVRLATGLGPRNQPPFLRLDLHNSEEHVSLLPSQPWDSPVKSLPNDARGAEAAETLVCGICQDTLVPTEAFALTCRHWYCEGCWQGYIHNAVNERSVTYTCPHPDCKFIVTSDMQCFFCDEEHNINARTVLIK